MVQEREGNQEGREGRGGRWMMEGEETRLPSWRRGGKEVRKQEGRGENSREKKGR